MSLENLLLAFNSCKIVRGSDVEWQNSTIVLDQHISQNYGTSSVIDFQFFYIDEFITLLITAQEFASELFTNSFPQLRLQLL